jgi:RNA polymerase sigma-70 factor (ECF subfamily)
VGGNGGAVTRDGTPGHADDPEASRSDAELLQAHADGDPDAFGELVHRHRDRLWAVALRTLGHREEAADALQDALVSAFRAGRGGAAWRGDSAVTTWLHRIVVNACLDRVRRRAARPTDPLPEQDIAAPGDELAARVTALAVEAALRTLPIEQRSALVLVDMYGWSVEDAAQVLDCPTGTVKSRCARGRARLLPLLREGNPPLTGDVTPPEPLTTSTEPTDRTSHHEPGGDRA